MIQRGDKIKVLDHGHVIGMPPGSPNLVGACMRKFAVQHKLVPVGFTKSKSPSRHAGRSLVWGEKQGEGA